MANVSMHPVRPVPEAPRETPLRVVAGIVLMMLTIGSVGLVYCYLTTPTPATMRDATVFPRLPMHPF